MSVTRPVEMKVAQTLTAVEASLGDDSELNAGVKAELIWAWYCSNKRASEKSGSDMDPKIYISLDILRHANTEPNHTVKT